MNLKNDHINFKHNQMYFVSVSLIFEGQLQSAPLELSSFLFTVHCGLSVFVKCQFGIERQPWYC